MIKTVNNKSFRSFFLKLCAFFLFVFFLDFLIGYALQKYYYKQESGFDYLTTYSIEQAKADILIFGSSRARSVFDSKIIEGETGLTTFNLGRDGEPIFYHYAVLKAVLKRYTPKKIILSIDAGNFSKNQEAYDRLSVLLPYYHHHPEMRPVIKLKSPFEELKLLSRIYPYNSLLLSIVAGNTAINKQKYHHQNGFSPLNKTISGPLQTFDYTKETELDSIKINVYRSFIKDCINSKIQLYIVCTPYMINSIGKDLSIIKSKQIAEEYQVDFYDYSRDSFYANKPELFADYRHLNKIATGPFTQTIIEKIKMTVIEKKKQ